MTTKNMIGIDVPNQTSEAAEHVESQMQAAMKEAMNQVAEEEIEEVIEEMTETPTVSEHVFSELSARKNEVKHYDNMLKMHITSFLESLKPITDSLKIARNKLEGEQEILNSKYDLVFAGIREAEEEYKHFNEAISFLRRFARSQ